MKKTTSLICVILLLFAVLSLSYCALHPYDEQWIIGKTAEEIQEKYGTFDFYLNGPDYCEERDYCNCACGYIIKEGYVRWPGDALPDEIYLICFDTNGFAYEVDESYYRPGG